MSETGEPAQEPSGPPPASPPAAEWSAPPPRPTAQTGPPGSPRGGWPAAPAPALAPAAVAAPGGNRGGIAAIITAMVLLLAGTVASWIYVHQDGPTSSTATVRAAGGQRASAGGGSGVAPRATSSIRRPTAYPSPYSTPTPAALDLGAVQRTMEAYLNAVQNHDLPATKSLVCPRFRAKYLGTYSPQGYAYSGWSARYQNPVPGPNYTYVVVTQGLLDTRTGVKKGSETHSWYVERDAGLYYVCGYLT